MEWAFPLRTTRGREIIYIYIWGNAFYSGTVRNWAQCRDVVLIKRARLIFGNGMETNDDGRSGLCSPSWYSEALYMSRFPRPCSDFPNPFILTQLPGFPFSYQTQYISVSSSQFLLFHEHYPLVSQMCCFDSLCEFFQFTKQPKQSNSNILIMTWLVWFMQLKENKIVILYDISRN